MVFARASSIFGRDLSWRFFFHFWMHAFLFFFACLQKKNLKAQNRPGSNPGARI
jgi:hypothetical protein